MLKLFIRRRVASGIVDVKTRTGVCCGSDHLLVQTKFRCRINNKKNEQREQINKLDNEKLRCPKIQDSFVKAMTIKVIEPEAQISGITLKQL